MSDTKWFRSAQQLPKWQRLAKRHETKLAAIIIEAAIELIPDEDMRDHVAVLGDKMEIDILPIIKEYNDHDRIDKIDDVAEKIMDVFIDDANVFDSDHIVTLHKIELRIGKCINDYAEKQEND